MRNIALKLMYVGTAYHGWQIQKNAITVQEALELGISKVVKHPVRCVGAGRTDAGVHAEVYIANFRTDCAIPCDRMPLAFNARLPDDIVVVSAKEVSDDFNAIGSCIKKEYTYRVYNSRIRNAFYVHRAYFYPKILDEQVMAEAAARFVGTHDFKAVRDVGTPTKTTVRTVHYFDVARKGDMIEMKVCANGFLYNMVRAMVGAPSCTPPRARRRRASATSWCGQPHRGGADGAAGWIIHDLNCGIGNRWGWKQTRRNKLWQNISRQRTTENRKADARWASASVPSPSGSWRHPLTGVFSAAVWSWWSIRTTSTWTP